MAASRMADISAELAGWSRREYRAGAAPIPEGSVGLDALARDPALLGAWFRDLLDGRAHRRRDFARAALASQLSGWMAEAVALPLVASGRLLVLDPAAIRLRWNRDGWIDAAHLGGAETVATERVDAAADAVVRALDPIFVAARAVSGYGRAASWRTAVDALLIQATNWARQTGADGAAALAAVEPLVAAVIEAAEIGFEPRVDWVDCDGTTVPVPIKSVCCLVYHVRDRPASAIGGYCQVCPLLSEEERALPLLEGLRDERRLAGQVRAR